jgi:hypothetical protein
MILFHRSRGSAEGREEQRHMMKLRKYMRER